MKVRWFFLCSALTLLCANEAFADGAYQRTKEGKTLVWNPDPKREDAASWSGKRDEQHYATGEGIITWYRVEKKYGLGMRVPVEREIPVARYSGKMVGGKLEGPVAAIDEKGKKLYATFADGNRSGEWGAGPVPAPAASQTPVPANEKRDEPVKETVVDKSVKQSSPGPSPSAARRDESARSADRTSVSPERPPGYGSPGPANQHIVDNSGTNLPSQKLSSSTPSSSSAPRPDHPTSPSPGVTGLPSPDATSPAKVHVAKRTTMELQADGFSAEPTPIPHQPPRPSRAASPSPPSYTAASASLPSHSESIRERSGATGKTDQNVARQPAPPKDSATAPAKEVPAEGLSVMASPSATSSPIPDQVAMQRVSRRTPGRNQIQADDLLRSLAIPPAAAMGAARHSSGAGLPPLPTSSTSVAPAAPASAATTSVSPSAPAPPQKSTLPSISVSAAAPPLPSPSALPSASPPPSGSPFALPQLDTAEVIGLAEAEARKKGYDLGGYQGAKVDYTVAEGKWSVWYDQKPAADGMIDVGKRFAVTVEDKTKKTSIAGR